MSKPTINVFELLTGDGEDFIAELGIPRDATADELVDFLADKFLDLDEDDYIRFEYMGNGITYVWCNSYHNWTLQQVV